MAIASPPDRLRGGNSLFELPHAVTPMGADEEFHAVKMFKTVTHAPG